MPRSVLSLFAPTFTSTPFRFSSLIQNKLYTMVREYLLSCNHMLTELGQLDRLVGLSMLIVATTVFLYYTIWTLLMVCI
jgi:hypothetical protein